MDDARAPANEGGQGDQPELRDLLPQRLARWARRATLVLGLGGVVVALLKLDTCWVAPGMNTVEEIPAGSWLLLDRWCSGLRVGSDVVVATPHGELVSRVSAVSDGVVSIRHPNPDATWGDSRLFGPLPREQVRGTVLVAFAPGGAGAR
ncbi:MAG: hypothetical protein ACON4Z_03125 [Planctomycetota bacterium]